MDGETRKPVKVVIGIPTEGHTQAESSFNQRLMAFHLGKLEAENRASGKGPLFEFFLHTAGRMFTPMAREKLVDAAFKIGADYIFMIDDDMLAPQDTFERLYRHNVDIVAALAFTRNPPYLPVLYTVREGWDPIAHQSYVINEWVRNYPKDKLVECDAVGFGCVLIKMDAIKKMQAPYFMSTCGTGEDILFCHRAGKAGARIFMDTSTKLGHLSNPIVVDEERSELLNKPEEMERQFGAYKKYKVLDVSQWADTMNFDGLEKGHASQEVVLAGHD